MVISHSYVSLPEGIMGPQIGAWANGGRTAPFHKSLMVKRLNSQLLPFCELPSGKLT